MPHFGAKSEEKLKQCEYPLQKLFLQIVKEYDCSILVGHRNQADQEEAFHIGASDKHFPDSLHNTYPSRAVDVAPYPIDWQNKKRFYYFAGYVKGVAESLGIKIRWGGDWDGDKDLDDQSLYDLVHFELIP